MFITLRDLAYAKGRFLLMGPVVVLLALFLPGAGLVGGAASGSGSASPKP